MTHTLYKNPMIDSSVDKKLTIYPQPSRIGLHLHFPRKLLSPMQRQVMVLRLIAILAIVCVALLVLKQNIAENSRTEINVEPTAPEEQTLPRHVSSVERAAPEMIPRVMMSRDQMENARRELSARKRRLSSACEAVGPRKSYLDVALANMIVDTEHNVSWCPIYKAASSTWMSYFAILKGFLMGPVRHNHVQISEIVRQKFLRDEDTDKTYKKVMRMKRFLIVRHPLERLLSAYRDKLEYREGREYYYKRFGRRIAFMYRSPGNKTKLEPTFEEFLRFIVREKFFDEHWAPYYQTCDPCSLRYDYILKFETLDRDEDFFIQDADLNGYLYEKDYVRNTNLQGQTTKEILDKYVKNISRSLLDEIYKIYESDYKLFDYSPV